MAFNFGAFVGGMAAGVTKAVDKKKEEEWNLKKFQMEETAYETRASKAEGRAIAAEDRQYNRKKQDDIEGYVSSLTAMGVSPEKIQRASTKGLSALALATSTAQTWFDAGQDPNDAFRLSPTEMPITMTDGTTAATQPWMTPYIEAAKPKTSDAIYAQEVNTYLAMFNSNSYTDDDVEAQRNMVDHVRTLVKEDESKVSPDFIRSVKKDYIAQAASDLSLGVSLDDQLVTMTEGQEPILGLGYINAAASMTNDWSDRFDNNPELQSATKGYLNKGLGMLRNVADEKARQYAVTPTATIEKFHVATGYQDAFEGAGRSYYRKGDIIQVPVAGPNNTTLLNFFVYSGLPNSGFAGQPQSLTGQPFIALK